MASSHPIVTLAFAQSLDGSLAAASSRPLALSGPAALRYTHSLRAAHDAILVGIGTVLADNPRLTVRHAAGAHPQPIVLDSRLRFPLEAALLRHPARSVWIAATPAADAGRQAALEAAGARVLRLPAREDGRVSLLALLDALAQRGVQRLMVEGGAAVITAFLQARLVDRLSVTIAPRLVGGLRAPTAPVEVTVRRPVYQILDDDMVLEGTPEFGTAS